MSAVTTGAWLLSNHVSGMVPPQDGATMRSDTQSVTIAADPERVFAFVADGSSLPRWAIGFAKSARPDGSGWTVS
jgi:hypothetical protein